MSRSSVFALGASFLVVLAGCGKTAAVFFDLPQAPQPQAEVAPVVATQAEPSRGTTLDTTRAPLPIEETLDPDSVLALLPRDAAGNVDWVAAERDGVIAPASPDSSSTAFGFDLLLKGEDPMLDAYFPHSAHVPGSSCATCHPRIFPYPGEPITMAQIGAGESCGRCHGSVAFPVDTCERCHPNVELPAGRVEARLAGDVLFQRPGDAGAAASIPVAYFPHWVHRIRYRCSACHPSAFSDVAGETAVTMAEMQEGKSCGSCHGKGGTFGLFECTRCHDSERAGEATSP